MFKRLGPISGDIMGSSLKVLTGPFKSLALPREHTNEAAPQERLTAPTLEQSVVLLINFDQTSVCSDASKAVPRMLQEIGGLFVGYLSESAGRSVERKALVTSPEIEAP